MKKFSAIALSGVTALCTLCACANKKPNGRSANFFAMDTAAFLVAANVGEKQFEGLVTEVSALLYSAENSLSVSRAGSCIYNFNRAAAGATVEIDEICFEALSLAKEVYEQTDGYFNPAVYYSEDLYGFAARPEGTGVMPYDRESVAKELPDGKYIEAFRELSTHFAEVEIFQLDGTYYATKPSFTVKVEGDDKEYSLAVDLGGIAKGLMVDKVNAKIDEAGIEYGYFNFGVSSMGVKEYNGGDGNYSVSSYDPRGSGSYVTFKMKNANLSTSGDYVKYYLLNGTRYCHIISPLTGSPIETGVASVTIVGGSAGRSDALTTALSVMGKQKAAQFINDNLSDCKVIMLIFEDGAGKVVTNAPDYFTLTNKNYTLANTVENGKIVLN